LNWFKKSAILNFASTAIEVDGKISLEIFCGSASHDAFKKSSIFSCFLASDFSYDSRYTEKVMLLGQFPLLPLHSSSTTHTVLYFLFSLPLSTGQQTVGIKVSGINLNWFKLVDHIFLTHI
jgi:hypothetical protein